MAPCLSQVGLHLGGSSFVPEFFRSLSSDGEFSVTFFLYGHGTKLGCIFSSWLNLRKLFALFFVGLNFEGGRLRFQSRSSSSNKIVSRRFVSLVSYSVSRLTRWYISQCSRI